MGVSALFPAQWYSWRACDQHRDNPARLSLFWDLLHEGWRYYLGASSPEGGGGI